MSAHHAHGTFDNKSVPIDVISVVKTNSFYYRTIGVFTLASSISNRQNLIFSARPLKKASEDK